MRHQHLCLASSHIQKLQSLCFNEMRARSLVVAAATKTQSRVLVRWPNERVDSEREGASLRLSVFWLPQRRAKCHLHHDGKKRINLDGNVSSYCPKTLGSSVCFSSLGLFRDEHRTWRVSQTAALTVIGFIVLAVGCILIV